MSDLKVTLVGYWNGNKTEPDIVFNDNPQEGYELVLIEITKPFVKEDSEIGRILTKTEKVIKRQSEKARDLAIQFNKLNKITRRLK